MRANRTPHKIHRKHFVMHAVTATTVFLCGVAADVGVIHWERARPAPVLWSTGEYESNHVWRGELVIPGMHAELGLSQDGTAVWRKR